MSTATPLPIITNSQYLIHKKSSTNWSKNPRNCHVMLKLLGDCLAKSTNANPCVVYNNLLEECKKVSKIKLY
jgi:hypothetical protein